MQKCAEEKTINKRIHASKLEMSIVIKSMETLRILRSLDVIQQLNLHFIKNIHVLSHPFQLGGNEMDVSS